MRQNRKKSSPASLAQRAKISEAMKKKWQDQEYRKKALKGMESYRESLPPKPEKKRIVSKAAATIQLDDVFAVAPMQKGTKKKRKRAVKVVSSSAKKAKAKKKKAKKSSVKLATTAKVMKGGVKEKNGKNKNKPKDDGDISRMREERRDLYDLLYGDESEEADDEEDFNAVIPDSLESEADTMALFGGGVGVNLDDENLDDYDPYGLDDE